MNLPAENIVFFLISLGIVFSLLRLYFQGFHKLSNKTSRSLFLSLLILVLIITFLPQIKTLFAKNDNWIEIIYFILGGIAFIWFYSFKKEIMPRFTSIHWVLLPGLIGLLLLGCQRSMIKGEIILFPQLLIILAIVFFVGTVVEYQTLFYGPRKLLQKYLYLFFLNMILSFMLLIPLGWIVFRIIAELGPLDLSTALTIISASSFFPYPVLNIIYLIDGTRETKEDAEVYRQRIKAKEKFLADNNLYQDEPIGKKGLFALFLLFINAIWIWFFKGNPLLSVSLILNLSFFF